MYAFDKIIICCHLRNIQSFIVHSFGQGFDATGYLSKLCEGAVYSYAPHSQLAKSVGLLITNGHVVDVGLANKTDVDLSNSLRSSFGYAFSFLAASGIIGVRELHQVSYFLAKNNSISIGRFMFGTSSTLWWSDQSLLLAVARVLELFFGSYEALKQKLESIRYRVEDNFTLGDSTLIASCLLIQEDGSLPVIDQHSASVEFQGNPYDIHVVSHQILEVDNPRSYFHVLLDAHVEDALLRNIDPYSLLRISLLNLNSVPILL